MTEKEDLKQIEEKIGKNSKISMNNKDFNEIHQKLMNAADNYEQKERRGALMKKIGVSFSSVAVILLVVVLIFSTNIFTNTDDYAGQENNETNNTANIGAEEQQDIVKSTDKKSIEEIKEDALADVLENHPNKSEKDLKARVGKIIDIDAQNNSVLFEGEISKGTDGKILFTPTEENSVDSDLVGKKVLTIGDNSLLYSDPAKGGLYKVIVVEN